MTMFLSALLAVSLEQDSICYALDLGEWWYPFCVLLWLLTDQNAI